MISVRKEDRELDVDVESDQHGVEEGTMRFTDGRMALMDRTNLANKVVLKQITKEQAADLLKRIEERIKERGQ